MWSVLPSSSHQYQASLFLSLSSLWMFFFLQRIHGLTEVLDAAGACHSHWPSSEAELPLLKLAVQPRATSMPPCTRMYHGCEVIYVELIINIYLDQAK